jgi:hypothetical protein
MAGNNRAGVVMVMSMALVELKGGLKGFPIATIRKLWL